MPRPHSHEPGAWVRPCRLLRSPASSAAIHHVMGVANVAKPLDKANAILQKPYDAHKC